MRYLALLRGINVGGKNRVPMARLKACVEQLGCRDVQTYIASGNVIFSSALRPATLARRIEQSLLQNFTLDSELVKVLVLTHEQVRQVVDDAPPGFGTRPDTYHSDAIFLIGIDPDEAFAIFNPRAGVDRVWPGELLVYSQRLSAERTRSRLSVIASSPLYKSLTIRSWQTTLKLLHLMDARDG